MSPSFTDLSARSRHAARKAHRGYGFTIVELMIAVAIGLFLIAAASLVYIGNRRTTTTQKDLSQLAQSGAFALSNVSKLLQQAGHVASGGTAAPVAPPLFCGQAATPLTYSASGTNSGGAIEGLDNSAPTSTVVGDSDQLIVRFYGSSSTSGAGYVADGSITDCYGNAVDGPTGGTGATDRSWAKLFVQTDTNTGNPALYCTYINSAGAAGMSAAVTQPLVDNVESFQVLYGVGAWFSKTNPATTLPASAGSTASKYIAVQKYLPATLMTTTDWNNVIAVRLGFVISGDANSSRALPDSTVYNVLGPGYPSAYGGQFDAGSSSALAAARRNRLRQVFSTTIELKNAPLLVGCDVS